MGKLQKTNYNEFLHFFIKYPYKGDPPSTDLSKNIFYSPFRRSNDAKPSENSVIYFRNLRSAKVAFITSEDVEKLYSAVGRMHDKYSTTSDEVYSLLSCPWGMAQETRPEAQASFSKLAFGWDIQKTNCT